MNRENRWDVWLNQNDGTVTIIPFDDECPEGEVTYVGPSSAPSQEEAKKEYESAIEVLLHGDD